MKLIESWRERKNPVLGSTLDEEMERVWAEYMLETRSATELKNIVADETIDVAYRIRALEVALTYPYHRLRYRVNLGENADLIFEVIDFRRLDGGLAAHAAKIIKESIGRLRNKRKNREAFSYNGLIQELLPALTEEEAGELFDYFEIENVFMGNFSPLRRLLTDEGVEEKWKKEAAGRMHLLIENEERQPRYKWSVSKMNAFECYRTILSDLIREEPETVSREFVRDELVFMMGVGNKKPVLHSSSTWAGMRLLGEPLCYQLLKRQIQAFGTGTTLRNLKIPYDEMDRVIEGMIRQYSDETMLIELLIDEVERRRQWRERSENERSEEASKTKQIEERDKRIREKMRPRA